MRDLLECRHATPRCIGGPGVRERGGVRVTGGVGFAGGGWGIPGFVVGVPVCLALQPSLGFFA